MVYESRLELARIMLADFDPAVSLALLRSRSCWPALMGPGSGVMSFTSVHRAVAALGEDATVSPDDLTRVREAAADKSYRRSRSVGSSTGWRAS